MPTDRKMIQEARDIAGFFFPVGDLTDLEVELLGRGRINDSFLLHICEGENTGHYVLQRINRRVFPETEKIMANLRSLANHFTKHGVSRKAGGIETIRPFPALEGKDFVVDHEQNYWRIINYVEDAVGYENISRQKRAGEMGRVLGLFHRITGNLDTYLLSDSLPGFHVTSLYLAQYDRLVENPTWEIGSSDETHCLKIIAERRDFVDVLEDGAKQGLIRRQVIHGDPKMDNILFDRQTERAVALIDLDTVKPGLLHYDIGDCLRSACNPAEEDCAIQEVVFDLETCRDVLREYFREMGQLLTEEDIDHIFPAVRLMTFELGLRFFSDHLAGDVYFKTDRPSQNLHRAMVQFALLESLEGMESEIRTLITEIRSHSG